MLTVLTWRWGRKYGPEYVAKLAAGVARNLKMPHRFMCVTDQPDTPGDTLPIEDPDLIRFRDGCYARLRMFDPDWQARHGIERLVCLDLDMVVVGELDSLFGRPEPFMMLRGGHFNPCPYNGSVMMVERGAASEVWTKFKLAVADTVAHDGIRWRGSDQTWIAHIAPDATGWTFKDGIYGYDKPGWPGHLPQNARLVAFTGKRDPSTQPEDWVSQHWTV